MEKIKIGGIMQSDGRALVRIVSVPRQTESIALICGSLGRNSINIEMLVQTYDLEDQAHFSIVVSQKDMLRTITALEELKPEIDSKGVSYVPDVTVISIFGPHLREKPKVPGMMFSALASVGISPLAVSNSISSVGCVIKSQNEELAVSALTEVFEIPFKVSKRPGSW